MHIAIIGAGPTGIEAGLAARAAGHRVSLFEAGEIGQGVRDWGHVRLFTPWHMNTSERGRALVDDLGDLDVCPTGAEFADRYLIPLGLGLDVRTGHRLIAASRGALRKGTPIGGTRGASGFRLLFDTTRGETVVTADALFDCTGVSSQHNPAGIGGMVAEGERELAAAGRVTYGVQHPDNLPADGVIAVVGAGATGSTLVRSLVQRGREVLWITGAEAPAFSSPDNDPLDERRALWLSSRKARNEVSWLAGVEVTGMESRGRQIRIHLTDGNSADAAHLVACTGHRPDLSITRELQVHHCYASEGPMKLAAALLASSGDGGDCLQQVSQGPEVLKTPEPRFFVLGAKSYGRRNDFLLQIGRDQIRDALTLLG